MKFPAKVEYTSPQGRDIKRFSELKALVKVLVIDDNEFNLDIINEYMEDVGFDVVCKSNAVIALKYLEENPKGIDIIILDNMMPHMYGIDMLRKIKTDERFKHIPVVMVTACNDNNTIEECMLEGASGYITKPFERDALVHTIRRALRDIIGPVSDF